MAKFSEQLLPDLVWTKLISPMRGFSFELDNLFYMEIRMYSHQSKTRNLGLYKQASISQSVLSLIHAPNNENTVCHKFLNRFRCILGSELAPMARVSHQLVLARCTRTALYAILRLKVEIDIDHHILMCFANIERGFIC
jgi:hypothetical protein